MHNLLMKQENRTYLLENENAFEVLARAQKLKDKGFIKMDNFKRSKNKMKYIYILTPGGIAQKTKLTINFMKYKMREYDELRKELNKSKK